MDNQETLYKNGFNNGYILAKHEPELLTTVTKNLHPAEGYLDGLFSGKDEWEIEHSKGQISELKNIRNNTKDRELDLEK